MTECQGCGAWNDARRTHCVLCGTPLAETDEWDTAAELPPLPPLPDGGLSASMPSWLREPPRPAVAAALPLPTSSVGDEVAPLGPRADPRTFLSDDDFPLWLRELAAREAARAAETTAAIAPSRPDWPAVSATASPLAAPATGPTPAPESREPAAVVATRAREERRNRGAWETLLLILLGIGIVIAAVWALVANGVISLGL